MGRNFAIEQVTTGIVVALYARAWVEIGKGKRRTSPLTVALYARAWVEILKDGVVLDKLYRRPLREGVGRNSTRAARKTLPFVALYARAWVEICTTPG